MRLLNITTLYLIMILSFIGCGGSSSTTNHLSTENREVIISGYVIDEPIVGATIEVYDLNQSFITKFTNSTDETGKYSIQFKGNYSFPLLLKVTNGEINGTKFDSTMLSLCYDSPCNITPITTIVTLSFATNFALTSKEELSKFAQESLGVDNWQSLTLNEHRTIANYLRENHQSLDDIVSIITSDMKDGYLDDEVSKTIFPHGKIRQ
ncbi:MAG: hypothetical protein DSY46_03805, partial [Hydrogenimonas sp.]